MKTATEFLNAVRVDYISESHRGYFEEKIKDAMERYANYRVSQALPKQADQHLFNALLNICSFTALDDDMQMIKDAIIKDSVFKEPVSTKQVIHEYCVCSFENSKIGMVDFCFCCNTKVQPPF